MSTVLTPAATTRCPTCGDMCFQGVRGGGVRGGGVLIGNCPSDGVFVSATGQHPQAGSGRMNPEERLWLIEGALTRFLVDPDAEDFMVLQSSSLPCNYMQFRHNRSSEASELWAEVCSREWDCQVCGNPGLDERAKAALGFLGFEGGGHFVNPEIHHLRPNPLDLAVLADGAMRSAFAEAIDYEVGVYFKRADSLADLLAMLDSARPGPQP
jgi:hypothetical protein